MNDSKTMSRPLEDCRVLLVEDCPDQQRLYLRILQQAGAEVTLECNGAAAIAAVMKPNSEFDVVVTDFQMPVMDGLQSTVAMRHAGLTLPIIAISALQDDDLAAKLASAGCDAFFAKPAKPAALIEAIVSLKAAHRDK